MSFPIGVSNLHYAIMTDETLETYGTPVAIPGVSLITITPNPNMEFILTERGTMENACLLGSIEVEMAAGDITSDVKAILLGHSTTGGMVKSHYSDQPPYVAIGFKTRMSNGEYRYVWLVKGRFYENNTNSVTKTGNAEMQIPKLVGAFMSRDTDGFWKIQTDPQVTGYTQVLADGWFSAVK